MGKADNKLSGARNLGILGTSPLGQADKFKPKDPETLYRFGLDKSSRFDLSLSGLVKKTNADVEIYRFKRPANDVISVMGNLDFRFVSGSTRDANLQLMAASKRKGNKNENIALSSLESGDYVIRVLGRSGKSRYGLGVVATPLNTLKPPTETEKTLPTDSKTLPLDNVAPSATLNAATFTTEGSTTYNFTVNYSDNVAVNASSLDDNDVLVTGPNGFSQLAKKMAVSYGSGTSPAVTYQITAPVGTWSLAENGSYSVALQANQASDTNGNFAPAASLGSFLMNTPLRSLKFSGTSNGPMGTDYIFDIDTSTGTLNKFGLTIYTGTPFPQVYGSTKLELFKNSPSNFSREESENLRGLMPTTHVGQFGIVKPPDTFYLSQIIYFARLGDASDAFGKPTDALVLGIQTANPDLSDPLALLRIALDGETPGTGMSGFYSGYTEQSFTYTTIPSARLDRLTTPQVLPDGSLAYDFQVTYSDNVAIDISSIDDNDILVNGELAKKVAVSDGGNGTPITATYRLFRPSSVEIGIKNEKEVYFVRGGTVGDSLAPILQRNQIKDTNGNFVPSGGFYSTLGGVRYALL